MAEENTIDAARFWWQETIDAKKALKRAEFVVEAARVFAYCTNPLRYIADVEMANCGVCYGCKLKTSIINHDKGA